MKSAHVNRPKRCFIPSGPAKKHLFRDQMLTAKEIAAITGIKVRTSHRRLQLGLPIEGPAKYGPAPRLINFRGVELTRFGGHL